MTYVNESELFEGAMEQILNVNKDRGYFQGDIMTLKSAQEKNAIIDDTLK